MDTKLRKQETMRGDPSDGFEHSQGSGDEVRRRVPRVPRRRQRHQCQAQGRRLFLKTADPELPALVRHPRLRSGPRGGRERETVEQPGSEEQCDHGDAES
ncbi:MAG: hypothetical protein DMG30_04965 [Acidobacteria bacterium]|nr:MAG: hypothetical protein DMG30_04965 [Acidobacteriota bacterium]